MTEDVALAGAGVKAPRLLEAVTRLQSRTCSHKSAVSYCDHNAGIYANTGNAAFNFGMSSRMVN
jgi:hypothetical protein